MTRSRVLSAILLSPLVVPIIFVSPTSIARQTWASYFWVLGFFCVGCLPICYIAEIVLGAPVLYLFKRFKITSILAFASAGAVIGWIVVAVLLLLGHAEFLKVFEFSNQYLIRGILAGSISAAIFRSILYSGNKTLNSN